MFTQWFQYSLQTVATGLSIYTLTFIFVLLGRSLLRLSLSLPPLPLRLFLASPTPSYPSLPSRYPSLPHPTSTLSLSPPSSLI